MNEQLIQELLKRLDTVGNAAVSGGKYAFTQLVMIERVDAIVRMIGFGVIGLALIPVMLAFAKRNARLATDESVPKVDIWKTDQNDYRTMTTVCRVTACLGGLLFIAAIGANISGVLLPEASVIRSLLEK